MTLIPVSNICVLGSNSLNGGAGRWISHSSVTSRLSRSVSRQSPSTFQT